jgi:hypothetical protein
MGDVIWAECYRSHFQGAGAPGSRREAANSGRARMRLNGLKWKLGRKGEYEEAR